MRTIWKELAEEIMKLSVIVYETETPLRPEERFMAFLVQNSLDGDSAKSIILPVRFMSGAWQRAYDKATAFWNDETRKDREKRERAKELGKRNSARVNGCVN
jgi:hypothetical protein